jgi:hypothetical protein
MKEVIDRIIGDFNFEKVHRVMVDLGWQWAKINGIPSVNDLVLCAQELLQDVSKLGIDDSTGMGGFEATKIEDEDDGEGLELAFILTSTIFCTKWLEEGE